MIGGGQGFAVLDLADRIDVESLLAEFAAIGEVATLDYFSSNVHCSRKVARSLDQMLKGRLSGVLQPLLGDVQPFLAAFISKGPGGASLQYHQDWSYTDERVHRAVVVWIPLVDVGVANGCLQIIAGSHTWTTGPRTDAVESPAESLQAELALLAEPVPLRLGQAVAYDPAIFHGSAANRSDSLRPAAAIAFVPRGGSLIHVHQTPSGPIDAFEVDDSYYTCEPFRSRPQGVVPTRPWAKPVDADALASALRDHRVVAAPSVSVRGTRRGRNPSVFRRRSKRVLRDPRRDARLALDGFVTIPLLSSEEALALRDEFHRLWGWSGSGFHADLNVDDPAYRMAVRRVLSEALDGRISEHFLGHRPFLRNFLCKWPGSDSDLYLHQDWMYVDERASERTFVTWVALQDVLGHNGQLQVLRGSHRLDPSIRGTSVTGSWLSYEDVIRPRLESVPVRAGECVVFDNALVHCSFPNHTADPRVVAAFALRRPDAPLVYFRRVDEVHAARFDVDEDFFYRITPAGLEREAPSLPVAEMCKVQALSLTPGQLAEDLDELARPRNRFRTRARARSDARQLGR